MLVVGAVVLFFLLLLQLAPRNKINAPSIGEARQSDKSLTYFYDSDKTGNYEIYAHFADAKVEQITSDTSFDSWWPRISPDGKTLLYYRTPKGVHDTDYSKTSLWKVDVATGAERQLIANKQYGWEQHGHAEWSPDGKKLVMFAGAKNNPQIWTTNIEGGEIKQITNAGGVNLDPSWSSDGAKIVYIACPNNICFPSDQEVYVVSSAGGERERVTEDSVRDQDPYFSPDNKEIAFLSQTEGISLMKPVGVWEIRIVDSAKKSLVGQSVFGGITSLPTWSDGGKTIYTHQLIYGSDDKFDLIAIKRETMEASKLLNSKDNEEYISTDY